MDCKICLERTVGPEHEFTERHLKNKTLWEYANNKSKLSGNRKGIIVACNVQSSFGPFFDCTKARIPVSAKPNEEVVFQFSILNDTKKDQLHVVYVHTIHSKYNFVLNNHGLDMGSPPQTLMPKTKLGFDITVTFKYPHIGQYETPIVFAFWKKSTNEQITIMRDMVVFVESSKAEHEIMESPYACKEVKAEKLYKCHGVDRGNGLFLVPKNYKGIYARQMKMDDKCDEIMKMLAGEISRIFETGITKENYVKFFHNLLWYEETMIRFNIKKYNMSAVSLTQHGQFYGLVVPGLAEKRPSLMLGDLLFVRPHNNMDVMFEAVIKEINDDVALVGNMDEKFAQYYNPYALFDIRFFLSRVPLERMHVAVHAVSTVGIEPRIFPKERPVTIFKKPKLEWYNPMVELNPEQRSAVEHIVAGTSGTAPYLLHGPPGTGKTVTIVEAILQLVTKNPKNRILVCTDSNMAADHVATMLIKYTHLFAQDRLLLRASSKYRVWETLPECLARYSNGTNRENFEPVTVEEFVTYNIVITTLSHSAKFGKEVLKQHMHRPITHLFIDEAAQACEPSCLIPITGLLATNGHLVLAGDPHQLGPVVISRHASAIGLAQSLMERLMKTLPMYSLENDNPNYGVMLRNNFRSNKEIIDIPDRLFYKGQLRACAKKDALSDVDVFGDKKSSSAVIFHGVCSKEQKIGKSPSYFNAMECDIVEQYVSRLVQKHGVVLDEIGIVTPYIRQVYMIKKRLRNLGYDKIEVGTVEAYQGKEKRVIIISTVRANCNLLEHDAKFSLGFLVDDKRFNVAITRAKAKLIIIGNPLCLERDMKWRLYIDKCRELGTLHGFDSETVKQNDNSQEVLTKIKPMLAEMNISKATTSKKKNKFQLRVIQQ
ncbi:putative helicase mov-10-B.2 [Anticarsia gemmatalis]|uniref:putative helicase mov-10-B.2 n=1 Tax=Anticarsia gemmatalis TaxID=129554 RepID=UPI003F771A03